MRRYISKTAENRDIITTEIRCAESESGNGFQTGSSNIADFVHWK